MFVTRAICGAVWVLMVFGPAISVAQGTGSTHPASQPSSAPAGTRPAGKQAALLPEPSREQQDASRELIRSLFKSGYAGVKAADMQALAEQLLETALDTSDDPTTRFVLLTETRDLATKSGDPSLAVQAVELLAREYEIDDLSMKADAFERCAKSARSATLRRKINRRVLAALDGCAETDRYDVAERLIGVLAAPAPTDKAPDTEIADAVQRIRRLKAGFETAKAAFAVLEKAPDDPNANLLAGRWHCFLKSRWDTGLQELSKCDDSSLKALAERELAPPDSDKARIELADGWWNCADAAQDPEAKEACRGRAARWYREALPQTAGLEKVRIEQRLKAVLPDLRNAPTQLSIGLGRGVAVEFVLIPAGEFVMGGKRTTDLLLRRFGGQKDWYERSLPRRRVGITRPFYIGKYEVTQAQWQAVMGNNPSEFKADPRLPVDNVSWHDCEAFCAKASEAVGHKLRLPTEAEWEYACGAGATSEYGFGESPDSLGRFAWYSSNSDRQTHPVGQKEPNRWGLYDMHGNLWEWCEDWYGNYPARGSTPSENPHGPAGGVERILRGGSWFDPPVFIRSTHRYRRRPDLRASSIGFRLVMEPY